MNNIIRRLSKAAGLCFIAVFLFSGLSLKGQAQSSFLEVADSSIKSRRILVHSFQAGLYAGSLTGLYYLWYSDYPSSSFHFFNDFGGWQDIDKAGHAVTLYQLANNNHALQQWAGMEKRKSALLAASISYSYSLAVEAFDGISEEWGASPGDILFNSLGVGLFLGQELAWKEQRILLKYSTHLIDYSQHGSLVEARANQLFGTSLAERALKDYNAQTLWLSVNLKSFMSETSKMPAWLNVAFGYGAEHMLGANSNKWKAGGIEHSYWLHNRYSQYYLSLDIDFTRLPINSHLYKRLAPVLNIFKLPFPALELGANGGFRLLPLHF